MTPDNHTIIFLVVHKHRVGVHIEPIKILVTTSSKSHTFSGSVWKSPSISPSVLIPPLHVLALRMEVGEGLGMS